MLQRHTLPTTPTKKMLTLEAKLAGTNLDFDEDEAGNYFPKVDTQALTDLALVQEYETNLIHTYYPQHSQALRKQQIQRLQTYAYNLKVLMDEGDLEANELAAELLAEYPEFSQMFEYE